MPYIPVRLIKLKNIFIKSVSPDIQMQFELDL